MSAETQNPADRIAEIVIRSQGSARLYIDAENGTLFLFPNAMAEMELFHDAAANLWRLQKEFPGVFRLKEAPNKRGPGSVIFINTNSQLVFSEEDKAQLDWKNW